MSAFKQKWIGFWEKHDPDDVFSYNTFKMVTIRDRILGLIHHLFQISILVYIIVYPLVYEKQFLSIDTAIGALRIAINDPASEESFVDYYCNLNGSVNLNFPQSLPCYFLASDQIMYGGAGATIFITTHMTITQENTTCTYSNCTTQIISGPTEYFVGNIENFVVSIDHSPRALHLPIQIGASITGYLQTWTNPSKNEWGTIEGFDSLAADEIILSDFLSASQVSLDVSANDYLGATGSERETARYFGIVVLMLLVYDNIDNYWQNPNLITYYYRPSGVQKIDDFTVETVYINYPYERYVIERRGIRVIGVVTGELGEFEFQTFLIQLTTALALIKVATTVVDLVALNILPRRKDYQSAKFERTEDFSELMELKKKAKQDKQEDAGGETVISE